MDGWVGDGGGNRLNYPFTVVRLHQLTISGYVLAIFNIRRTNTVTQMDT